MYNIPPCHLATPLRCHKGEVLDTGDHENTGHNTQWQTHMACHISHMPYMQLLLSPFSDNVLRGKSTHTLSHVYTTYPLYVAYILGTHNLSPFSDNVLRAYILVFYRKKPCSNL
jgi:hypothetical protein